MSIFYGEAQFSPMWNWLREWERRLPRAQALGRIGEFRAEAYLRRQGYKLVARNWRNPRDKRDELDLVMHDGEVLVFVEVKSRASDALVSGYHAVDHRKKKALRRACDAYLKSIPPRDRPRTFRFDVVEVSSEPHPRDEDIHHFGNVPLFPKYYWP